MAGLELCCHDVESIDAGRGVVSIAVYLFVNGVLSTLLEAEVQKYRRADV